jgi:hypothetical protein
VDQRSKTQLLRYDVTTAITHKRSGFSKCKHLLQTDVRRIDRYNVLFLQESKKLHLLSASSLTRKKNDQNRIYVMQKIDLIQCYVIIQTPIYLISLHIQPLKMELTQGSETSAYQNLTPGKYPKEYTQPNLLTCRHYFVSYIELRASLFLYTSRKYIPYIIIEIIIIIIIIIHLQDIIVQANVILVLRGKVQRK